MYLSSGGEKWTLKLCANNAHFDKSSHICDSLNKNHMVCIKIEFNFLPQFTDILNIYPSPVYQVLHVNWSAFLKYILPTLQKQWHQWRAPIEQWGPGFFLTDSVAHTVWASCLLMGCPKRGFLPPPAPPFTPHLSHCPSHPPLSISNTDIRKGWQKYHEIKPSEIEKVSYNKSQYTV